MKKWHWRFVAFISGILPGTAAAQTNIAVAPSTNVATMTASIVASKVLKDPKLSAQLGKWHGTVKDWNSSDWQRIQLVTNVSTGQLEVQTNQYTELANNLNFINDAGTWDRSGDSVELMTNAAGAAALRGATKVYFPPTLGGGSNDVLTIISPSNTVLKIRPIGLYYFDAQSGKSVLLASARQAQGEIVGLNQVVYKSIFSGCDVRITYTKAACESDLVMLARPKSPEAYGLNSAYRALIYRQQHAWSIRQPYATRFRRS